MLQAKLYKISASRQTPLEIKNTFPLTYKGEHLGLERGEHQQRLAQLNVGVVLSGGPAPGGHNVISGLFDALEQLSLSAKLYGFCGGISGLLKNDYLLLDGEKIDKVRNTGGFNLLGTGRTKIESKEDMDRCLETLRRHDISALVIIGGDDSNTNAAFLAEHFAACSAEAPSVIGVPKTIDGDLKNDFVETTFGFDTATKVYAGLLSNIARDALSTRKQYHFIKLMGRAASHVALEVGLLTKPNFFVLSEEVKERPLDELVGELADLVYERACSGKTYGVVVIPEGLADVFSEIKQMTELIAPDPHGNPDVSSVDTERMLAALVSQKLRSRHGHAVRFSAKTHFFWLQGPLRYPKSL